MSDSQIINDRIVNETRFRIPARHEHIDTPVSTAPTYGAPGYFSAAAAAAQSSTGHYDHLELQNITTMTAGKQAIKFGTWLRDNRAGYFDRCETSMAVSAFPPSRDYIGTLNSELASTP